jgi:hypothetical protein
MPIANFAKLRQVSAKNVYHPIFKKMTLLETAYSSMVTMYKLNHYSDLIIIAVNFWRSGLLSIHSLMEQH